MPTTDPPMNADATPRAGEMAVGDTVTNLALQKAELGLRLATLWMDAFIEQPMVACEKAELESEAETIAEALEAVCAALEPGLDRDAALARALPPAAGVPVEIDYTNHEGERGVRTIVPTGRLLPGDDRYHPTAPWVLEAFDPEKGAMRTFDFMHLHRFGDQARRPAIDTLRAGLAAIEASGFGLSSTCADLDAALPPDAGAGAASSARTAFFDGPVADLWSIVHEEDEDLRVRAGHDYVAALSGILPASNAAPAGGGLPGVEEIAEALWDTDPRTSMYWRDWLAGSPENNKLTVTCREQAAAIRARLSTAGTGDAGRGAAADKIMAGLDDVAAGRFDVVRVAPTDPGARPEAPARSTAADGLRDGVQEAIRCLEIIASRLEKGGSPEIARGIDVGISGLRNHFAALDAAPSADRGGATDDPDRPDREEVRRIVGRYADHITLDEYEMSVIVSAALYSVRVKKPTSAGARP